MPEVFRCPTCGRPVRDDQEYVRAREYESAGGFGDTDFAPSALAKGRIDRFHVGHFRGRIGNKVWELVDDGS